MTAVYLITGGAGFIGSAFIRSLLSADRDVRVLNLDKLTYAGAPENVGTAAIDPRYTLIKGDIADRELVSAVFARQPIDYVVNFAAESHVDRSLRDAGAFLRTNVEGTAVLLAAARDAWRRPDGTYPPGCRFLQISTDEVYGTLAPGEYAGEAALLAPRSPYSASKASADLLAGAYAASFGLPVLITRCANNYGPYQFPEKLIPLLIHRALHGEPLPLYGDGRQVRDWLHVEDHCRALRLVLERGRIGGIYNISGHAEHTNREVARSILALVREAGEEGAQRAGIVHVADRPGHDRRYGLDTKKIEKELGWRPCISFDKGLRETVGWYLAHRDWLERAAGRNR